MDRCYNRRSIGRLLSLFIEKKGFSEDSPVFCLTGSIVPVSRRVDKTASKDKDIPNAVSRVVEIGADENRTLASERR